MTTSDSTTTETPSVAKASDDSMTHGRTSGSNLKAGLVLTLVLLLVVVAGAGYLIKNNEPLARQLLSWNLQIPVWLLPVSVSQNSVETGSGNAQPLSSMQAGDSSSQPDVTGRSAASSSSGAESLGLGSQPETSGSGMGGALLGSSGVSAQPSAPVRPAPQLDPAFRQSIHAIDQLARSLSAVTAGPQKPSLPKADIPKPSASLFAGAQGEAPSPMLEPGVFEKSLQFLQSLVRVQSVQGPDFSAQPKVFYELVNQQIQAQLAAARLALLLGEVALAERELEQTEMLLERHFDKADPKVFQLQAEFSGLRREVASLK
ncbi:MAG: hypothetical protein ACO3FW_03160 [Burkholderiaceae bacterium]